MKKDTKRMISALLAFSLATGIACTADVSSYSAAGITGAVEVYAAESAFTKQGGWFETAYAEWGNIENASGYAAYVKPAGAADSAYKRLDDELIRKYSTYFRVDALGLKAGDYVIKVVPFVDGTLDESAAIVTDTISVKAHDRSGAAFSSKSTYKTGSGAYNDDGTLKDGAQVIYVTKDTAKTVTAELYVDKKMQTYTGLQTILDAKQKGTDTTPLDIRIIGTVSKDDLDHISSSGEGLQIKGKNAYSQMDITIEGVGEDAAIKDFGLLLRNCGNVELRNFAVYACIDDCVSLDTDNVNIWVHNLDFFYGKTGGDSDQAKGDGTVDMKAETKFVTVSYNHFWDSGKSSLCGMTDDYGHYEIHVTYHHNWFDHSDSRHPRIRSISTHVYNNYFDGNAKYGVGVTTGASAFVESNYFEDCKHPMLSSLQGSDVMTSKEGTAVIVSDGDGTFSNESGGTIKAFNNIITGSDKDDFNGGYEPIYYDAADTSTNGKANHFDAYLATSRDEVVPSTVTVLKSSTKKSSGSATYNNFDTSSDFDLAVKDLTPVENVREVVKAGAGRINGGDFPTDRSKYTAFTDATSDAVDSTLKSEVVSYTSSLVSVGGANGGTVSDEPVDPDPEDPTPVDPDPEDPADEVTSEIQLLPTDITAATLSATAEGVGTNGAFDVRATSAKTVRVSSKTIDLGGAPDTEYEGRTIVMRADRGGQLVINCEASAARTLAVSKLDGETVKEVGTVAAGKTAASGTVTLTEGGTYYIYSQNAGIKVNSVTLTYDPLIADTLTQIANSPDYYALDAANKYTFLIHPVSANDVGTYSSIALGGSDAVIAATKSNEVYGKLLFSDGSEVAASKVGGEYLYAVRVEDAGTAPTASAFTWVTE